MSKEIVEDLFPGEPNDLSKVSDEDLIIAGTMGSDSHKEEWFARRLTEKLASGKQD